MKTFVTSTTSTFSQRIFKELYISYKNIYPYKLPHKTYSLTTMKYGNFLLSFKIETLLREGLLILNEKFPCLKVSPR